MRSWNIFFALGLVAQALAVSHSCFAQPPSRGREIPSDRDVKAYFDKLAPATKSTVLHDTTGPEAGADVGVITAVIPDPDHPEFSVFWVRDAGFVYHAWMNELTVLGDKSLRPLADDTTHALIRTQQVISLAGNVFTGGLEEAVFDVKINPIQSEDARIGSPAADGPPFRASVLLDYAEWLIQPEQDNGTWVADVLWPKLNLDLQWIASHWNLSSYDLWWPCVWGGSYWTASLQYRALRGGARLGRAIGRGRDVVGEYDSQASMILDYLQTFWNEKEGFMTETTITNVSEGRSGYGSAPLTVSVYNFDPSLGCDDATFQPCSPRALSSLKVVGDHFKEFFPISRNFTDKQPPFFGFFTEDQFLGGHPQFFSSFNSAEQLYDALITWDLVGFLDVTRVDLKFWRQFDSAVKIGRYNKGSKKYNALTNAVHDWANKIVLQLAANTPEDYVLVECVHKEHGGPYGPRGMIRSLAAALGVYDAYNGLVPRNWGHPIPQQTRDDREDVFASTGADEVIEWDADHDDEYRGVVPDLYRGRRLRLPSRFEDTTRHRYGH
ncbi:Six-hairpin glycosidase-like protein [Russula earlei]|uniref:Six-hairpin glycosidase-like protein n=1 Tax=Russula earlei TaxID=71964 RepID=A0ACC0TW71_9AGAM|nr:Six-hairpin glycosidase-like protein [Russula earlei]